MTPEAPKRFFLRRATDRDAFGKFLGIEEDGDVIDEVLVLRSEADDAIAFARRFSRHGCDGFQRNANAPIRCFLIDIHKEIPKW